MSTSPLRGDHSSREGWNIEDAAEYTKAFVIDAAQWSKTKSIELWGMTTRRMRAVGGVVLFTLAYPSKSRWATNTNVDFLIRIIVLSLWRPDQRYEIPRVSLHYGGNAIADSPYDKTKVALLIENRSNPILVPLILHFISVVPPDWRFRFMGSTESVAFVNSSYAIRNQVAIGKLDLTYIPANMSVAGQEAISQFLTNLWLYEQVLQPAEHLLVFQTDSMLCANSRQTLNDYLEYDWVGAPWSSNSQYGGNGGLSLRRVSAIIDVLRNQERIPNTEPEDVWLTERLGNRPGANLANGTVSLTFSGENLVGDPEHVQHNKGTGKKPDKKPADEGIDSVPQDEGWTEGIDDWREGFYEPMGYHTGGGGTHIPGGLYGTPELRKHIWNYCPELKMTLQMDAAEYVPGNCNQNWKREVEYGDMSYTVWPRGLELDENGYPLLPPGLVPW